MKQALILLLALAAVAGATPTPPPSQITFVDAPTGVNDGAYYVMPYRIKIDGVYTLVTCYDTFDDVNPGDKWQANLLSIGDAATSGFFGGPNALPLYERIAWLSSRTYSNDKQQVGLQHEIWRVFGSASLTQDAAIYGNAADVAAANGYAGFDFSTFRFIEQVNGVAGRPGTEQAFVFREGGSPAPLPEPGALAQLGAGALLILGAGRYWKKRR